MLNTKSYALATLGGGCFWCLEAVFERLDGVHHVESGYAGGHVKHPAYREVCAGTTGHAEVVQVRYDPSVVEFATLLRVFFGTHDPTTPNRQGHDVGPQYRSIILYHDKAQQKAALETISEMNEAGIWPKPIVTEVVPFTVFYPAEAYHQAYYRSNPAQPYCSMIISPKLAKLRREYASLLKT